MKKYLLAEFYTELNICDCGREQCAINKYVVSTDRDYHCFHYILSGEGTFIVNGKEYLLKKGAMFYIPPYETVEYYPTPNNPWLYTWVNFRGTYANFLLKNIGIGKENPVLTNTSIYIREQFNSLVDNYIRVGHIDIKCLGHLFLIFAKINEDNVNKEAEEYTNDSKNHITQAKLYMKNNYVYDISVKDIANNLNLTPNYLCNIFHRCVGMPPKKYLTNIRMKKACLLLSSTNMKIKDIALKVGYKNQLHFSGEFKKYKKMSPYNYRKQESYAQN